LKEITLKGRLEDMKNKLIFIPIFLLLFISTGLLAQSSNDAQGLVGTWVNEEDDDHFLIFYPNGTASNDRDEIVNWFVTDNKVTIIEDGDLDTVEFNISPDGNTLFLIDDGYIVIFKRRN